MTKVSKRTRWSAYLSVPPVATIIIFLSLYTQAVYAQSNCHLTSLFPEDSTFPKTFPLKCNLSISLREKYAVTSETTVERVWRPGSVELGEIKEQLSRFSITWCEATSGLSIIDEIALHSEYGQRPADIVLYKGSGRSYAHPGAFPSLKPSVVVYYGDADNPDVVNPYLERLLTREFARLLTREFARAVLKIYDEYSDPNVNSSANCSHPLASDNPRQTIMGDYEKYTRFSYPEDYANTPLPRTAQHRCYGKSAWEVLTQPEKHDSTLSLDINADFPRQEYFLETHSLSPENIPLRYYGDTSGYLSRNCKSLADRLLNIRLHTGSENIAIAIDSGIAQLSKAAVKEAVNKMIDMLARDVDIEDALSGESSTENPEDRSEKKLAIISIQNFLPLQLKDVKQNPEALRKELDKALADTPDRVLGIDAALDSLNQFFYLQYLYGPRPSTSLTVNDLDIGIIISDTQTMPSAGSLSFFKEYHIPVYTVGVGKTTNIGLRKVAIETGGKYFTLSAEDRAEAMSSSIAQNLPPSANQNSGEPETITINNKRVKRYTLIPEGTRLADFSLSWENDSVVDNFVIVPPAGISDDAISKLARTSRSRYTFVYPAAGRWEAIISGDGTFKYEVSLVNSITTEVSAGAQVLPRTTAEIGVVYPAPIAIKARIRGDKPVINATVKAEITPPNSESEAMEIALLDDGKSPDSVRGDGIYSGVISNYAEHGDGMYAIKVTANNSDGRAIYDDSAVATPISTQTEVSLLAPPFQQIIYHQVETTGTQTHRSNTNPDNPRDIKGDGSLSWGILKGGEHTDWYRFRTTRSGTHYIQTSNLLSHSDVEMATEVNLYEQSPNRGDPSFLATSVGHQGTKVSSVAHRLDANKDYLISVSHVDNDKGVYALTVNSEGNLISAHEINRTVNSRGGGGGGLADYLLLAVLLIALTVLHKETARRNKHD